MQNENDENNASTRLTRAKTAAGTSEDLSKPTKNALQPKRTASNALGQRKRAALGDVSNVGKADAPEGKKATSKGLVSKAAQPTGVQKNATRPASRTALATKDGKTTQAKKSGAGTISAVQKRKVSTTVSRETSVTAEEAEPVRKKAHTLEAETRIRSESIAEKENAGAKVQASTAGPQERAIPDTVKDLDFEDIDDPLMVASYANEIFDYLRELEMSSIPNPEYMGFQHDLEWKTRGILVDWLIEVHTRFHLLPETLFLAVNIIDRFLSAKVVQLDRLQLVGITAMFIAAKYEEVLSPHVENFKRIADNGFSEAEILSAERCVLGALDYDLSYPNPMNFLRRVSKADNYDIQSRTVGKYLMEISLLDQRFLGYPPSRVAAAAMFLSRAILDRGPWDETLAYYAGYDAEELEEVVALMIDYLARPVCHEAFFKKYASKKFLKCKSNPSDRHLGATANKSQRLFWLVLGLRRKRLRKD